MACKLRKFHLRRIIICTCVLNKTDYVGYSGLVYFIFMLCFDNLNFTLLNDFTLCKYKFYLSSPLLL